MGVFYIIVLDKNDTGNQPLWNITASSGTIELLQALKNHGDTIVMTLSKARYPGKEKDRITLLNNHNNQAETGKIYEVPHV